MLKKIFFLLFLSSNLFAQNNSKAVWKMVDNMIYREAEVDFKKIPSLAIGIIMQDSTYFKGFGSMKKGVEKGKEILPTDSILYEMGAFTKVFTATILAQAVTEGKIKLEDTVQNYLPKGYQIPTFKGKPIRFLDLASHTSGLPKYPYNIGQTETEANNLFKNYTEADGKEFLATYRLRNAPFEKYSYSHFAYEILAQALVHIYNEKNYETLLQHKILQPLMMKETGINPQVKNEVAQGYNRIGTPVPIWTMSSFEGSMGAKSTMRDLLKFMRLQIDTPLSWKDAILLTHKPQREADKRYIKVALAWHRLTVLKKHPPIIVHTGMTDGHRMYFGFVPETRTGVIILANSEEPMNALGPLILQMLNYNWKRK
jgi:serine-type D-Ala-D-Ala carboxypeptidase/endopeptidase